MLLSRTVKIITVDKGFYIYGGNQLFGKFKTLKACMVACATDATCFQGDYNPWLHKCYKHTNHTACGKTKSHPQFVHFSKVPCSEYAAYSTGVNHYANGLTITRTMHNARLILFTTVSAR